MVRYERDGMLAHAASLKAMKVWPEWAEGACITEPPNQIKKKEPRAGTCGLLDRESSTLNRNTIEQKPEVGNKDSELAIHKRFAAECAIRVSPPRSQGPERKARLRQLPCLFGKQHVQVSANQDRI